MYECTMLLLEKLNLREPESSTDINVRICS